MFVLFHRQNIHVLPTSKGVLNGREYTLIAKQCTTNYCGGPPASALVVASTVHKRLSSGESNAPLQFRLRWEKSLDWGFFRGCLRLRWEQFLADDLAGLAEVEAVLQHQHTQGQNP